MHVELFLRSRGALLVSILHDPKEIHRRLELRDEDFLKSEHVNRVIATYRYLRHVTRVEQLAFDKGVSELDYPAIVTAARKAEQAVLTLREFPTYVGGPSPQVLLLGETRGPTSSLAEGRHPSAFVPFAATSGHYLLSALRYWDVDFGLANALEENVHDLWRTLGEPLVVTLGSKAHGNAEFAGVQHGAVPHPQFIRRFFARDGERYAKAIHDAAFQRKDLRKWS